jgi:hypothetical protein
MKPTFMTTRSDKRFPLIECNYHSAMLSGYRGHCAKPAAPSFRNISRQYFQREARRDFIGEAFFFVAIVATAVAPFLSTASALTELCRALGQV